VAEGDIDVLNFLCYDCRDPFIRVICATIISGVTVEMKVSDVLLCVFGHEDINIGGVVLDDSFGAVDVDRWKHGT